MSVFEALAPTEPTAQQGAMRVMRTLAQAFQQLESSLVQVRQIMERHGPDKIHSALDKDRAEVADLYRALKALIEKHNPGSIVPDLPT